LCEAPKGNSSPITKTKIKLKMPDIKNFGGQSGPFKMTFASKEMLGDEFVFNAGVFKPDEEFKFE